MSRHDKFNSPQLDDGPLENPAEGRLQVDLRLRLDEVAAAEEEKLRDDARGRPSKNDLIRLAGKLYDARRRRDRMFDNRLFGEPAWDMLLALYALPKRGIPLGVTSLAYAANIPPTTGLRWQKVLLAEGLIERGPTEKGARQLVRLTETGRLLMERYLIRLYHCEARSTSDTE